MLPKVDILEKGGHYEVLIDDEFFCSADTYSEAVKEVEMYNEVNYNQTNLSSIIPDLCELFPGTKIKVRDFGSIYEDYLLHILYCKKTMFDTYVEACKERGFETSVREDPETSEYEAYSNDGKYWINVSYHDGRRTMCIRVTNIN